MEGEYKRIIESIGDLKREVSQLRRSVESPQGLIPKFLENSPHRRSYSEFIEVLFNPRYSGEFRDETYIMGFFDQVLIDKLLPHAKLVKIVSPSKALGTRKNKDALTRMAKAGAEVRTHPMLHARVFCIPKRQMVIIGSGDIQSDCFSGNRFDAGVFSNHPDLIKSTMDFFNRVWKESSPFGKPSID